MCDLYSKQTTSAVFSLVAGCLEETSPCSYQKGMGLSCPLGSLTQLLGFSSLHLKPDELPNIKFIVTRV